MLVQNARKDGDDCIGEFYLTQAQPEKARQAFEQSRAKGIVIYLQHAASGFTLQRLSGKP